MTELADGRVRLAAQRALSGEERGLRAVFPFLGPAFIASVAYLDPGNFATNIAGGAQFGYALGWVVLSANLMAMLVQTLSAKLGIATGKSLPQVCRDRLPRRLVGLLWAQAEAIAMATDLAEFTGAALGLHLVFGLAMWLCALLAGAATFAVLAMEVGGFRRLEAAITALVGVVLLAFVMELLVCRPRPGAVAAVASSCVGTMSGQVVMEGFLRRRIPVFARRAVTMAPALAVLALGFSPTRALVLSQVFLSFGIPFALIPLVAFTRDRSLMGRLANSRATNIAAMTVAAVIVALNVYLLATALDAPGPVLRAPRGWRSGSDPCVS